MFGFNKAIGGGNAAIMADEAAVQVYRAFIGGCVGAGAAPFTILWLTWNG